MSNLTTFPSLALALVACTSGAATTPTPDAPSSPDAPTDFASPTCTAREGAFVVAATDQGGIVAATGYVGSWSAPITLAPDAAASAVAFVDDYHVFGAFWVTADGTTRYRRVADTVGTISGPQNYRPLAGTQIVDQAQILIGRTAAGVVPSWFDPDGFSFEPMPIANPPAVTDEIGGALDGNGLTIVGVTADHVVFDQHLDAYTTWQPVTRHDALIAGPGMSPPTLVTFADGGAVLVTPTTTIDSGVVLAATTRAGATWSAPVLAPGADRMVVAAAATPDGEVVVATRDAGGLTVLRFSRTTGWRTLATVDLAIAAGGAIVAAPGTCGDDALFGYVTQAGEVRTVRVRGDRVSAPLAVGLWSDPVRAKLALVTRGP